ncbi:MAG: hypothetical protein HY360_05665 [Verrucomicrobia bacterium]|nr:hypothetical protein [Verrucomicrobiota bacterium]
MAADEGNEFASIRKLCVGAQPVDVAKKLSKKSSEFSTAIPHFFKKCLG